MRYLVRIYIPQKDKADIEVDSFEKAIKLLNVNPLDESQRVEWGSIEDVYFKGTRDYIRIIK